MKVEQLLIFICILFFSISTASGGSAGTPVLQIGHITDVHYGQYPADADIRLRNFTSEMNSLDVDFVVSSGDMVHDTSDGQFINEDEYNRRLLEYLSVISEFDGPVYHMFGNHDVLCQKKSVSIQALNNETLDSRMPSNYYYFDSPENRYRFIVLDGQYTTEGDRVTEKIVSLVFLKITSLDNSLEGKFNFGSAGLQPGLKNPAFSLHQIQYTAPYFSSEELDWLEETLQDAKRKKYSVVIFHHQPIKYHPRVDGEISPDEIKEANGERSVSDIIEESGIVQCVIQGHLHRTDTVIDEESGVYYLTSEASVEKFNAYSVIKIFEDHSINISGEINQQIDSPEDNNKKRDISPSYK